MTTLGQLFYSLNYNHHIPVITSSTDDKLCIAILTNSWLIVFLLTWLVLHSCKGFLLCEEINFLQQLLSNKRTEALLMFFNINNFNKKTESIPISFFINIKVLDVQKLHECFKTTLVQKYRFEFIYKIIFPNIQTYFKAKLDLHL